MAIIATKPQGGNFTKMAEGMNPAVIFQVEDLGLQPVNPAIVAKNRAQRQKEGGDPNSVATTVHKVRINWNNEAGEQVSRSYKLSLHEKSNLYKDVKAILGAEPGDAFDLEGLVGVQNQLLINHETSRANGKTYANIAAITKPAKGQNVKPLVAKARTTATPAPAPQNNLEIDDNDIPF